MKNLVFLTCFLLAVSANGQSKHVNIKRGYAANGYDVVAYFDGKAVEGDKSFAYTHKGVKYKFSSEDHRKTFAAHPERYLPQYGGFCAYAVAVSGKKVGINPETYEIRDGKLYLFYNSGKTNTLELWLGDSPNELKDKADANWTGITNK